VRQALAAHAAGERSPGGGILLRRAVSWRRHHADLVDGKLPIRVSVLDLGEAAVVFFPGEIFLEAAETVRAARPERKLLTVALCDGLWGYIPTPEAWQQGGYEPTVSQCAPGVFEQVVTTAKRLLAGQG
jgi:hypothetical protein